MLNFLLRKEEIFRRTDPDHIYVENVRSFFNLPFRVAKLLCDMAVKEQLFEKKVGFQCPGCSRILISVSSENEAPEVLHCDICEGNEMEIFDFKREEAKRIVYYKLKR